MLCYTPSTQIEQLLWLNISTDMGNLRCSKKYWSLPERTSVRCSGNANLPSDPKQNGKNIEEKERECQAIQKFDFFNFFNCFEKQT